MTNSYELVLRVGIGVIVALAFVWTTLIIALVLLRPKSGLLREAMRILPDTIRLLRRLATDKSIGVGVRVRLWLLFAYLANPVGWILFSVLSVNAGLLAQSLATDTIARCEPLVLSQAEASRNSSRDFALDIKGAAGSQLVYVGVHHTFDPADPQFVAMQRSWEELQPTEAFFEGPDGFVGDTLAASLQRSGEPGLVRYLASIARVPSRSLEPTREDEVTGLLRSFTAEQLVLFYVTRNLAAERDRRNLAGPDVSALIERELVRAHTTRQLSIALPDVAAFRAAYERWLPGMDPTVASARWFDPLRTSTETGVFFNDVDRESSALRDVHMYRLLASAWRPGARIFAEVGRDHIPAQAAALRCALQ